VPDPFATSYTSFGAANNARLRAFLDSFASNTSFQSATDYYKSGKVRRDAAGHAAPLRRGAAVMLPTLGEERRATYSPFLPISPKSGRVLQVPMVKGRRRCRHDRLSRRDGSTVETPVTGGNVKLAVEGDWAGRWFALGVDYECTARISSPRPSSVRRS